MILYGIREEFYMDKFEEKFDAILLLLKDGIKYEYSQKKKILRKVNAFVSPSYITKKRNIKIDLNYFMNEIPFENDSIAYKSKKIKGYVSAINEDLLINIDNFENNKLRSKRFLKERPVWIFKGDSLLGKSYIASFLSENKEIYETDSSDELPGTITADIIVIGNKYNYSINAIRLRIPHNSKIIEVDFSTK